MAKPRNQPPGRADRERCGHVHALQLYGGRLCRGLYRIVYLFHQRVRSASFLSRSSLFKPTISNILCLLLSPPVMTTAEGDTPKNRDTNSTAALFALPSMGGAQSRNTISSPRMPANSVFFALGMTRIFSFAAVLTQCLSPNNEVPMRTIVAPSSTATSKS